MASASNNDSAIEHSAVAELVELTKTGDKQAFVELVTRHQALVSSIALGIIGDFAASEDVAQESFIVAWNRIPELREPGRFSSWLAQITRNTALIHRRQRRDGESLDEIGNLPDDSLAPDASAVSAEEKELVSECLQRLPEKYRLPLILHYREGASTHAVAAALEITEDTARQRLSRGRKMLRDEVDGLVESVLARTSPSSAFTVSVATAIGALTVPAAVAEGAFSSVTANSVSSSISVMSASKTMMVATAVVAIACIPIGYQLPKDQVATPAELSPNPLAAQVSAASNPSVSFVSNNGDSELSREWDRLHDEHGGTADAMPALYAAIAGIKDPLPRRAFHIALVTEWLELDPVGGFNFYFSKNGSQKYQFFYTWLERQPDAAVDALLQSKANWKEFARGELERIARHAPGRIGEITDSLPKPKRDWYRRHVRDAYILLAEQDLESAREIAAKLKGPNRDDALAGIAAAWARSDWDAALKWASELPVGVNRDEVIRRGLAALASKDPVAALEQMNLVPPGVPGASRQTTGGLILGTAAEKDLVGVVEWVVANPGRLAYGDLSELASEITKSLNADAAEFLTRFADDRSLRVLIPGISHSLINAGAPQREAIWEWTKTRPASPEIDELRKKVLGSAAWQDTDLAFRLAAELPDLPNSGDIGRHLASYLWNGSRQIPRFAAWYEEAPESLRPHIASTAFKALGSQHIADPRVWIDRLNLVAKSEQQQANVHLARAWTRRSPEDASAWAGRLPAGETKREVIGEVITNWARRDAPAAAEWMNTFPPGEDRDSGTESLVQALSSRHPVAAWDWALSVQSVSKREKLAADVVRKVANVDANTAQRWIAEGPFTASTKAELYQEIGR